MHIVKYTESERGRGGEVWFIPFDIQQEALEAVQDCNKDYDRSKPIPSYYIIASYEGEKSSVPRGYKT